MELKQQERPTSRLESIGGEIRSRLSVKDEAREKALHLSRQIIRFSSESIRAAHRGEYEQSKSLLTTNQTFLNELKNILAEFGDLLRVGFTHDAQKEFAEASITLALLTENSLPSPDELGVSDAAYLNGLGEAAGELRRHLLDLLRKGEVECCEGFLEEMDDIYSLLVTVDFPDALTGGLRRTTDMVRGVLERTRGDLTLALRQKDLEKKLDTLGKKCGGRGPP